MNAALGDDRNHPPGFALLPDEQGLSASLDEFSVPALITRADLAKPGPTIIAVSPALCEMTQYPPTELLGRNPRLFQGPLTDRTVLERLRRLCEQGEAFVGEAVNYRKDGGCYMVQWTINPIRDRGGRVTHFLSLQQDVTRQHRYASEWLAIEAKHRATLELASAQMAVIAQAICVLEKTKRSFRSKELGDLRAQLLQASRAFAEQIRQLN